MTKHEVTEYLTKIYKLPVVQVRTQNYLGKRMRIIGKRSVAYAKRPDYKKAFVTFDNTLVDVGLGSRVDGLPGSSGGEMEDGGGAGGGQQQQQIGDGSS
jgi:large subunit ribosomal protein L23